MGILRLVGHRVVSMSMLAESAQRNRVQNPFGEKVLYGQNMSKLFIVVLTLGT